ncbi:MAG: hypothetical protein NC217_05630 [Muribaculaceae bacterium]|nr:hypothetical protein [Muribaculaceae bacterium]
MKHSLLSQMSLFCVSVMAVAASATSVSAETVDLGELKPFVTYSFPGYQEVKGEYTPSETGPVKIMYYKTTPLGLYSDASHEEGTEVYGEQNYTGDGGQMVSYDRLEGGKTYYIYQNFTWNEGSFQIIEGSSQLAVQSTSPAQGQVFSASRDYRIEVSFNVPITVGAAYLIAGDERARVAGTVYGNTASYDVYEAAMNLYHAGYLKEGDEMTLRIMQVADKSNSDNLFDGTGKCEVTFKVAAKPAELTNTVGYTPSNGTNPLNSYYFPGDEAAKMQLIFDTPLRATDHPVASISYGNPDNLELGVYREDIVGYIDGNVATFDFSGKRRRTIDMLPGADASQLPTSMYVAYTGLYTPDGQQAYTGMMSNPNSFSASYSINNLLYTIAADFTPARGSALAPGAEVEIWVMNGAYIQFDNIYIDYFEDAAKKSIRIPMSAITIANDPDSSTGFDKLYTFTVPEFKADADSEITLSMNNVTCADGLDHTNDVTATYKSNTSGLEAIDATAVKGDVYDITGKLVLRDVTRGQLNTLDKGIYIYNGKKIAIK